MSNLYNLTGDYERVLQMLYDDEHKEDTVIDTLDSIEGAIEDKADGYAMVIRSVEADVAGIKAEIERLQSRKKALENKVSWLKTNLENSMRMIGKTKFKTALFSFGIQKNGGKRALILDCDVDALPSELQKVTVEANNEALRQLLEQEKAESNQYAHLAPQGESLRIR